MDFIKEEEFLEADVFNIVMPQPIYFKVEPKNLTDIKVSFLLISGAAALYRLRDCSPTSVASL